MDYQIFYNNYKVNRSIDNILSKAVNLHYVLHPLMYKILTILYATSSIKVLLTKYVALFTTHVYIDNQGTTG